MTLSTVYKCYRTAEGPEFTREQQRISDFFATL
jgi:hypothetical protein